MDTPDYFLLLGMQRRPGMDQSALKEAFLRLSSKFHPDKAEIPVQASGDSNLFARLNEAYHVLKNPKTRILHLLDLEGFEDKPKFQSIPADIANLFTEVGKVVQSADRLNKELRNASSPMVKASLFQRNVELTDHLQEWQRVVQDKLRTIELNLLAGDQKGEGHAPRSKEISLPQLYEQAVAIGFLQKLLQQIDEKISALAF